MNTIPQGFRLSGVHSGIKQDSQTEDIALMVSDGPCVAAGVYTQNQIVAAPVIIDRERTPTSDIRAVVVNSGNANAFPAQPPYHEGQYMHSRSPN